MVCLYWIEIEEIGRGLKRDCLSYFDRIYQAIFLTISYSKTLQNKQS